MHKHHFKLGKRGGFTLLELLVVIGIIAILAGVVIVALNPARQFAQARNTQRSANVNAILNAVGQNMADNQGVFKCSGVATTINTTSTLMASSNGFNIAPCIVPTYVSLMPFDPNATTTLPTTNGYYTDNTLYNSGYNIVRDASSGRITVSAPSAELGNPISVTR